MTEHELPSEKKAKTFKIAVKQESATSEQYGSYPNKRTAKELLNCGIVIINKPAGPTSHEVSAMVQKIVHSEKCGHTGTLDPQVTGVLPVAIGKATRIVQALLQSGKEYIGIMLLHADIDEKKLMSAIKKLSGKIDQLPPVRSAVKRELRERTIYYLDVLEIEGRNVLFKMGCEGGTYVRKWVHDLGEELGCGAHMTELLRTKAGPYTLSEAVSLQQLQDAVFFMDNDDSVLKKIVLPIESALKHIPCMWVMDNAVDSLCHGALLHVPGVSKLHDKIEKDDDVAILTLKGELIGLAKARMSAKEILSSERGVAVRMEAVMMDVGIYPALRKENGQQN